MEDEGGSVDDDAAMAVVDAVVWEGSEGQFDNDGHGRLLLSVPTLPLA